MKLKTQQHWGILVFATFIVFSCNSDKDNNAHTVEKVKSEVLPTPQLLIDFEQDGMVQPASVEILSNNEIAILDSKINEVFIFNHLGEAVRRFGGNGKGPGEFSQPRYVDISPGYINVIDAELHRVSQFNYSGNFKRSYNFEENPYSSTIAVMDEEKYFVGSMGKNGSLIKLVDFLKDSVLYFGKALGEENPTQRLEMARQTLAGGEIPGIYQNEVTLYFRDKHLYAFLNAHSRLRKYTANGKLLWEIDVDLDLNKIIFQQAVEQAKNAPTDAVPNYRYITNMKVVDGQVFLLWMPVEDQPRKLVRINENGKIATIYHIPEKEPTFFDFAIDFTRNKLYLSAPQMGQVYETEIQM